MHCFDIYGLRVESDIFLPGAKPAGGAPDAVIRVQPLDDAELEREGSRAGRVWGCIYQELQFLVEGGTRIVVDNRAGIGEDRMAGYVLGVLLATLLRQRGRHVLHASSVARDGLAVGFVGESGWGKSTLAAFLCRNGYRLVADDMLVLEAESMPPSVLPGPGGVQLRADSGAWLHPDFAEQPAVCEGYGKRITSPPATGDAAVTLARLYILDPDDAPAVAVRPMSESEALLALLRHSRASNILQDPVELERNFRQCASLARHVPVVSLHRRRTLDCLPEVLSVIEADLHSMDTASPQR
jgi:hypothetical protein